MKNQRRCSFCGKLESECVQIISGPNDINICNECIEISNEIIAERIEEQRQVEAEKPKRVLIDDQCHRFKASRLSIKDLKKLHSDNFKLTYPVKESFKKVG